jgi:hypothetical protein
MVAGDLNSGLQPPRRAAKARLMSIAPTKPITRKPTRTGGAISGTRA